MTQRQSRSKKHDSKTKNVGVSNFYLECRAANLWAYSMVLYLRRCAKMADTNGIPVCPSPTLLTSQFLAASVDVTEKID